MDNTETLEVLIDPEKTKEKDIRQHLHNSLIKELYIKNNNKRLRIFHEFNIGSSRIDTLVVKDFDLIGFELKSGRDNLTRLLKQMRDYSELCNYLWLITTPKHLNGVLAILPEFVGISILQPNGELKIYRSAHKRNIKSLNPKIILSPLWVSECKSLINLYKKNNRITKLNSPRIKQNLDSLRNYLITVYPADYLYHQVCQNLLRRPKRLNDLPRNNYLEENRLQEIKLPETIKLNNRINNPSSFRY